MFLLRVPLIAALLAVAAPPAPAVLPTQSQYPATTLRAADLKVAEVAYRIGLGARSLCPDPYPLTGLLFHHLAEYDPAGRAIEVRLYGLDRGPGVLAVVENSPAAKAGLVAGDVLLDVNGTPFADPVKIAAEPDRKVWRAMVEASEAQLETALRAGPARLRVLRGSQELSVTLSSEQGCPIRIRLARSPQLNAFSDGRYVTLTTRMLEFTQSDDELAIIIGHELAHNVLGHKERLESEQVPQGWLAGFGKNASRVKATEVEADRFGLKLAWTAGFNVAAAIPYWHRFYAAKGGGLQIFRTHPGLHAREQLVRDTIAELAKERTSSR